MVSKESNITNLFEMKKCWLQLLLDQCYFATVLLIRDVNRNVKKKYINNIIRYCYKYHFQVLINICCLRLLYETFIARNESDFPRVSRKLWSWTTTWCVGVETKCAINLNREKSNTFFCFPFDFYDCTLVNYTIALRLSWNQSGNKM